MDVATIRLEVLRLTYRKDMSPEENTRIADALIEWISREPCPAKGPSPRSRGRTEDKGADDRAPL